jgi:CheY-like chemotaxis protein
MDHMMPEMDGIEATGLIREIDTDYAKNIPIIALTANAIVGNEEMFLSHGFQDFISKPIDLARLDAVLRDWVRDKSREEKFLHEEQASGGSGIPAGFAIGGIDIQKGLVRFGNDGSVLADVLRSYAVTTRPLLARLQAYLDEGDLADYTIVIHGIKGSSYGIFAAEAGAAAERLEGLAREGRLEAVAEEHPAFAALETALLDRLDLALAEMDAKSKAGAEEPDPALLRELKEACGEFDIDRVDSIMARLEAVRYERGGGLVSWLRERVDESDFVAVSGGVWPSE